MIEDDVKKEVGHIHRPCTHYISKDDVVMINGDVRIPRRCRCGAVIEMKNKVIDGICYRGWFE